MKTLLTNQWFITSGAKRAGKLRLFCFAYAGGGAGIYRMWHRSLPDTVELHAFQLPGHGSRMQEPLYTDISPVVSELAAVFPRYFDKPFALFGHSLGALIAFELARSLRNEHGIEPLHLFVAGRGAPQFPDRERIAYALPDAEFIEELRRLNGTPEDVLRHPELMQLMLPVIRADFQMCQTYKYEPQPPLSCPITAFGGLKDSDIPRIDISGWQVQTTAAFAVRMLPGTHFFLHENEQELLHILAQDLRRLALSI